MTIFYDTLVGKELTKHTILFFHSLFLPQIYTLTTLKVIWSKILKKKNFSGGLVNTFTTSSRFLRLSGVISVKIAPRVAHWTKSLDRHTFFSENELFLCWKTKICMNPKESVTHGGLIEQKIVYFCKEKGVLHKKGRNSVNIASRGLKIQFLERKLNST